MSTIGKSISSLVSTHWLAETLSKAPPNFRILDGSWHMPAAKRNPKTEFEQKHIPTANFFGIDECCDKNTSQDHMLPDARQFEQYVGNLGINNSTHVVVYDNNEKFGLFSSQRVWWIFRVFGHNLISVLDGGLPKWERDGFDVTSKVEARTPHNFVATYVPKLVKNFPDIERNLHDKQFTVIDGRASGRFCGIHPEPRPEIESGHIPGSVSLPFMDLLDESTCTLKPKAELEKIFQKSNVDLTENLVGSCGTGISACLIALAAYQLGKEDLAVYDGSWTEWYQKSKPEQRVKGELE